MSNVEQVTVGDATFNVAQAPANKQKELLLLIGPKVSLNSATSKTVEIDTNLLFGVLLGMPEQSFNKISEIVLHKVVKNGSDDLIDIKSFQGNMVMYFQLVAEAVKVNLQDFFTYLDKYNAEVRNQPIPTNQT